MADDVFSDLYAAAYDTLYADKDYEAECDVVEAAFARYGQGPLQSILDLGCGTGSHAIPFIERGYEVVGVDRAPDMVAQAEAKLRATQADTEASPAVVAADAGGPGSGHFVLGDVRTVDLGRTFDAVVMMFAVLGYQRTPEDVHAALAIVRRHLRPGGVFLCDVWYAPAVLAVRPEKRRRSLAHGAAQLTRTASAELDAERQLCTVRYTVEELGEDGRTRSRQEEHVMRFFHPQELTGYLADADLAQRSLTAFPDLDAPATDETWNALVVAG